MEELQKALTLVGLPLGAATFIALAILYGPRLLSALGLRLRSNNEDAMFAAKLRETDELRMRSNMEKDIDRLRDDIATLRTAHGICEAQHEECRAEVATMRLRISSLEVDRDQYLADRNHDADIR